MLLPSTRFLAFPRFCEPRGNISNLCGAEIDDFAMDLSLLENRRVPKGYTFVQTLRSGTQATIVEASKDSRQVAIRKIIRPFEDPYKLRCAIREYVLLKNCRHQNIVELIEVAFLRSPTHDDFGEIMLVMPLIPFRLSVLCDRNRSWFNDEGTCCLRYLMVQLLRGLDYLHTLPYGGVIHRDICTNNVMIYANLSLQIIDFGVARESVERWKKTVMQFAALPYRSPEQALEMDNYTTKTDIWSAGCIFAELIAGEHLCKLTLNINEPKLSFTNLIMDMFSLERFSNEFLRHAYNVLSTKEVNELIRVEQYPLEQRFPLKIFPKVGAKDDAQKHTAKNGFALLKAMLQLDPEKRCSAAEALDMDYLYWRDEYSNRPTTPMSEESRRELTQTFEALKYAGDDLNQLKFILKSMILTASQSL